MTRISSGGGRRGAWRAWRANLFGAGLLGAALSWALPVPAIAGDAPGIHPIAKDLPATEIFVYPPENRAQGFHGHTRLSIAYPSAAAQTNRVGVFGSEPGTLTTQSYPMEEFVLVLEGTLVTTDTDGTRHEFGPGDTFVIPKGWAGTWHMTSAFRKMIVNF